MIGGRKDTLVKFERWTGPLFLIAGGFWLLGGLISAIHTEVDEVFNIHVGDLAGVVMLISLIVSFGCIVGLYVHTASLAPRLATGGVLIGAFTFSSQVMWLILSALTLTSPMDLAPVLGFSSPLAWFWALGFVAYPIGFAFFSIASLRTDIFSPIVGYLLLSPLVIWIGRFVSELSLGEHAGPLGTAGVMPIAMAASFLAVGYLLRNYSETA